MATMKERALGDILVDQGVISPLELDEALQRQRLTGDMLGRVLVKMGLCEEQDIIDSLGMQSGMEKVDVTKLKVTDDILRKVDPDVAKFYMVAPIRERDGKLVVAMANPMDLGVLDTIAQLTGQDIVGAISNPQDVSMFIKNNYAFESENIETTLKDLIEKVGDAELTLDELGTQEIVGDVDNLVQLAQEPEVIKIVNLVLLDAITKRASDIHFEVYEEDFRIRIRIDGVLHEISSPPKALALALTCRVKIMCSMDIGERRLPQDARIELKIGDSEVDIRVATLPTLYGECVVMRILDRTTVKIDIEKLGFEPNQVKQIKSCIGKPNGIFLVTGPTGSGKTTTLYACLSELNEVAVKIITTEDPVELKLDRVVQVQVREEVGLTFGTCLRSILRQDPDIVMVGEIRDLETAQIAVEASLTGHLVLSTLHTNSAAETITRLLDMDLEPFLITSSLTAVLAQRLVRVVCRHCRKPYKPELEEMELLGLPEHYRSAPNLQFWKADGCPACDFIGYMGRVGLFELLVVDEQLCDLINDKALAYQIRQYARRKQGMRTLREEGIIKCLKGVTTTDEILAHTDKFDD